MKDFPNRDEFHKALIDSLRALKFVGSWVMFNYGTFVMPRYPASDIEEQAVDIMKEHGPVLIGSPAADFTIRRTHSPAGLLVYYDCPDIFSFVPASFRSVFNDHPLQDFFDAMSACACRGMDAQELEVAHVEKEHSLDKE